MRLLRSLTKKPNRKAVLKQHEDQTKKRPAAFQQRVFNVTTFVTKILFDYCYHFWNEKRALDLQGLRSGDSWTRTNDPIDVNVEILA